MLTITEKKKEAFASFLYAGLNLAVADVHGNFKTETHFGNSWFGPHDVIS
jgi:hypothetical protein